jgi:hypothetical protein
MGRRAPEIKDKDDGIWREWQPIQLFNGRNLSGWQPQEKDRKLDWTEFAAVTMTRAVRDEHSLHLKRLRAAIGAEHP